MQLGGGVAAEVDAAAVVEVVAAAPGGVAVVDEGVGVEGRGGPWVVVVVVVVVVVDLVDCTVLALVVEGEGPSGYLAGCRTRRSDCLWIRACRK